MGWEWLMNGRWKAIDHVFVDEHHAREFSTKYGFEVRQAAPHEPLLTRLLALFR